MKIAIIEVVAVAPNPIDAHVRNAIEIFHHLKAKGHEVHFMANNTPVIEEKFDVIIFSYASFYFDFKRYEKLVEINDSTEFVWITNEYNLSMNSFMRKKVKHVIANFRNNSIDKYNNLVVNLNTLLFRNRNEKTPKKYDICYYGTHRPDRAKYFKKYLKSWFILSTSPKNHKLFKDMGCICKFTDKFHWQAKKETLNQFKASLYIEDEYTHECFNHLANRFYEAITCNCALFFDRSCLSTIQKSNCDVDPFFIVDSYEEIKEKMMDPTFDERTEKFLEANAKLIIKEREETLNRIEIFLNNIVNNKNLG